MQKEKLVLSSREKHENDPDSNYTKKSVEMGCKLVLERSVSDSIRKSVSNGMLYVEDEIRTLESERSHGRRTMV